ncbi:hypothetical protein GW17_00025678 [Ensete ventricosum]|nr:hypothetical protein GW17_00025678 [Ensete ventricosum]
MGNQCFRYACDAPTEVSQHWYQSQAKAARRRSANPHAGPATHGQAAAKAPCKEVADCGQGQPAREAGVARRGSSPQGRQLPAGKPTCSVAPAKGAGCRAPTRGYRPRPALPLAGAATPVAGVAAPCRVVIDGQGQPLPA